MRLHTLKQRRIVNPSNDTPYVCRECREPLRVLYVDYVGCKYPGVGVPLYDLTLSCVSGHKRVLQLYPRDGEWLANLLFTPLDQGSFKVSKKVDGKSTYKFKTSVHNLPRGMFLYYRKYFQKIDKSGGDLPIYHRYQITDKAGIVAASREYKKRVAARYCI